MMTLRGQRRRKVEMSSVWMPRTEAASRNKTGGEAAAKRPEVCLLESKTDSRLGPTLTNQGLI